MARVVLFGHQPAMPSQQSVRGCQAGEADKVFPSDGFSFDRQTAALVIIEDVVPLVPLTCLWDGIVSQLRAYSVSELKSLTQAAEASDYSWRVGRVPILSTPGDFTYLIGSPSKDSRDVVASKNRFVPNTLVHLSCVYD